MTRRMTRLALVALFVALTFSVSGCQMVRKKLGITTEVSDPAEGTPAAVIHKVMHAALLKDTDKGFRKVEKLFHHKISSSKGDVKNWRTLYWPKNARKKIRKGLFFEDDDKVVWKFAYTEGEGTSSIPLHFYVYNEGNPDHPTPCMLARDDEANDEWRISGQCL